MPSGRPSQARLPRLPFEVKVPNATTRRAMAELGQGRGKRFDSGDALFEDLDI
jgi:DNA-damage-inducible protein J